MRYCAEHHQKEAYSCVRCLADALMQEDLDVTEQSAKVCFRMTLRAEGYRPSSVCSPGEIQVCKAFDHKAREIRGYELKNFELW